MSYKEQPDWNEIPFIVPESGTARDRANIWFNQMKINPISMLRSLDMKRLLAWWLLDVE